MIHPHDIAIPATRPPDPEDIENTLMTMLAEEITKDIDKEILKSITPIDKIVTAPYHFIWKVRSLIIRPKVRIYTPTGIITKEPHESWLFHIRSKFKRK